MNQKYKYFLYILTFLICLKVQAQRFGGSAVVGLNLSQIDGDGLAGYDKAGLTGGIKLDYAVSKKSDLILEFLYSQRGSAPDSYDDPNFDKIKLTYLEIPLLITLKDWYIEGENYHKVWAEGGFSYSYLFSATSENPFVGNIEEFKDYDISYILGVGLRFTKNWAATLRYTRGMVRIYEALDVESFISYFITLRAEYKF